MLSRTRPFLVCLVLGVTVSVLVAWRCAVVSEADFRGDRVEVTEAVVDTLWERHAIQPRSDEPRGRRWRVTGRAGWDVVTVFDPDDPVSGFYQFEIEDLGWPRPCLRRVTHRSWDGAMPSVSEEFRWTLPITVGSTRIRLPLRPQWAGLAVNAGLYGSLVFLAGLGLGAVRRRARLDRRRCPRCVYQLVPDASKPAVQCSECGTTIPSALLTRPRQVLRWWMTPILLAPVGLGLLWFAGGLSGEWTRVQVGHAAPLVRWPTVVSVLVGWVWLLVLCERSYRDRPTRPRYGLAAAVALVLVLVCSVSVYVLGLRLWAS